jgi:nitrate reductase NapE component
VLSFPTLSLDSICFVSTIFLLVPWWIPMYKSSVNFFSPPSNPRRPSVWYSISGFIQGSHFFCLRFCGNLDYAYSTICEEVDILVWRCESFSMIKTNLSREPAYRLTDENIGMRAIEHVIRICLYGNHRYPKCVVNRYELQLTHGSWTLDSTIRFRLLRLNLCYVLLYCLVGGYGFCMAIILFLNPLN